MISLQLIRKTCKVSPLGLRWMSALHRPGSLSRRSPARAEQPWTNDEEVAEILANDVVYNDTKKKVRIGKIRQVSVFFCVNT